MTEKEWNEIQQRAEAHVAEMRIKLRQELNWDAQEEQWDAQKKQWDVQKKQWDAQEKQREKQWEHIRRVDAFRLWFWIFAVILAALGIIFR